MCPVKLKNLSEAEVEEFLPKNLIFLGYRGSLAHGTYVPPDQPDASDDKDIMGMWVNPLEYYFGFGSMKNSGGRQESKVGYRGEWDLEAHEVRKMLSLMVNANPNVFSTLWLEPKSVIFSTPYYELLREKRDLFVSKRVYHTFTGYAHSQLKKLESPNKEGYMGAKRKELFDRIGYDSKNASHLVRLLKQSIEFLTEGTLYVERKDAAQLLAIKRGEWQKEDILKYSDELFRMAEMAYVKSDLPNKPNYKEVEKICMDIILDVNKAQLQKYVE